MPNDSLDNALKEVYALAPNDQVVLDTIEISYVGLSESLFLVKDHRAWTLGLETGEFQEFRPVGFQFIPPAAGKDGFQELTLSVDNVSEEVTDFFELVGTELTAPVDVIYRPYLSSSPNAPQMDPPLHLFLTDITMDAFKVSGRATFTNIVNAKYPSEYYTRARFPGLAS